MSALGPYKEATHVRFRSPKITSTLSFSILLLYFYCPKVFTIVLVRKADLKFYKVVSLRRHTGFLPEKILGGGQKTIDHCFLNNRLLCLLFSLLFYIIRGKMPFRGQSPCPPIFLKAEKTTRMSMKL